MHATPRKSNAGPVAQIELLTFLNLAKQARPADHNFDIDDVQEIRLVRKEHSVDAFLSMKRTAKETFKPLRSQTLPNIHQSSTSPFPVTSRRNISSFRKNSNLIPLPNYIFFRNGWSIFLREHKLQRKYVFANYSMNLSCFFV